MAFFKLRQCDVISSKFTAHPSYRFNLAVDVNDIASSSEPIRLFNSGNVGTHRQFFDINGTFLTSSYHLTGHVELILNAAASSDQKRTINRLRHIYASSSFYKPDNYLSSAVFNQSLAANQDLAILNIPSIAYGSEIKPGSLRLSTSANHLFTDDGYGGLYSGSVLVGSIYYQHGIAHLGQKFFDTALTWITCSFSGTHVIPTNIYMCRVPRGALNFTNNPSYISYVSGSNRNEILTDQPKTFITTIGLYDKNYELVGVAKVASPVLNEEETGLLFKLKLVF